MKSGLANYTLLFQLAASKQVSDMQCFSVSVRSIGRDHEDAESYARRKFSWLSLGACLRCLRDGDDVPSPPPEPER